MVGLSGHGRRSCGCLTTHGLPADRARSISTQLFGVTPGDPLATVAAVVTLLAVTLAAAYLPARRATRIKPVVALRYE